MADILQYVGTMARILVPLPFSRRFIEHFPLGPGDEVQESSKELGYDYQFVIYIHHHVPRDAQLRYILRFSHQIEQQTKGMEDRENTVRFLFSMSDRMEQARREEVEPPYSKWGQRGAR